MLFVLLALSVVGVALRCRPSRGIGLSGGAGALAVFVVHALVEGTRWQMVPAYIFLAGLALVLALRSLRKRRAAVDAPKRGLLRKIVSAAVRFGLLPLLCLSFLFPPVAFPVFQLPEPPTWQGVGVTDMVASS